MPSTRTIPILASTFLIPLLAWAQAPVPTPAPAPAPVVPEGPTMAENVMNGSTIKVREMERIAAEIRQEVDMLNQKFILEGHFYKDTNHRIRLLLNLKGLGDTGSTMLQVCDGKTLWDYQNVLDMKSYRRREITPILKRLDDPNLDAFDKSYLIASMGFGGPEAMLSGLTKAVKFDQVGSDTVEGVDVFVLGGTWKDRSGLMGPGERPLSPTAPLPPYIPSNVRVFVGKLDGWPYRIEMIGNAPSLLQEETRQLDPSGRPIGRKTTPPKVDPSKITLYYKLLPPTEIKPELFLFQPPAEVTSANLIDDTEKFLADVDRFIQFRTTTRKAEAAKNEGEPLLKAPLEIQAPPPGAPPK